MWAKTKTACNLFYFVIFFSADGSVTFSVLQVEDPVQQEVPPQPMPHDSPAPTSPAVPVEPPVASKKKGHLIKKKLVPDAKQRALKLAAERHQQNKDHDEKLFQERLDLIRHEKELITAYYAKMDALLDLKIKHEIERHEKEMASK